MVRAFSILIGQPSFKTDVFKRKRAGFDPGKVLSARPFPNYLRRRMGYKGHATAPCNHIYLIDYTSDHRDRQRSIQRARVNDRDPDSLLSQLDALSRNDNWIKAEPLFRHAEILFAHQHRESKALYAHVSQIPPNSEFSSLTDTIFQLTNDLARPEAADPETHLRILTIRGMLETDYDAASARSTWAQVAELARRRGRRGHLQLALRATGEQGIAHSS
jgi:hypothetical protein